MSIRNAIRHRPVSGLVRASWASEARVEKILGIESAVSKSHIQLRMDSVEPGYAEEARDEARRLMEAGVLLFKKQKESEMISATRFQSMHNSLSGIAQKVFAAVPASDPWSVSYIHSEMSRLGSSTKDVGIVQGCLNHLKDAGLVMEPSKGTFIRAPVKAEKPAATEIHQPIPEKKAMTPTKSANAKTPVDILSALATRCRALADDLDTAALEIDESMAAQSAGLEKLAQFQQILKSLNA